MVKSFDEIIAEQERKRENEYQTFMNKCHDKITDGDLIYRSLALFIAKRFNLNISSYRDLDNAVYIVLNHYVENIDEDFETWINKNDAPLIRNRKELRKIFHEFSFIESDEKLVGTVNKIYNLDLELTENCIISLSFDFNSFTPINANEIHEIKNEIKVLKKHGYSTDELEEKLNNFGLDKEILEAI